MYSEICNCKVFNRKSALVKKLITIVAIFKIFSCLSIQAQTNPVITSWLINTTNIMGRHYVKGNSTPVNDNVLANVQTVQYSATSVYIRTKGIPAYITGPFLDGNPSLATDQNAIFKFPLNPVQNTGTPSNTTGGNIGIFINGVALFDYRDGVAWNNATQSLCGGPGNPPCPGGMGATQAWNRDAIPAERAGFDCAKAHPAMGNYHHHQNPSAFNLDLKVISNVCDLYAADGLYAIDSTKHSPLIGFAYDGFPVYGAYAYKNIDGSGGIVRIKSSYSLNTGTTRINGPAVSTTYSLGYFREDYHYNTTSSNTPDYLDEHNGRFCITPEYPNGIYCYFATVDENWNSAYPYVVGPTFYGKVQASKVASITESVTNYTKALTLTVSTSELLIGSQKNSSKTFDIVSNTDWNVSSDQTWLVPSKLSGSGNESIILTAQENSNLTTRTATITIAGQGTNTQIITVTQDGTGTTLSVSKDTLSIGSSENSKSSFEVYSNTKWTISSSQNWLTSSISDNIGDATVTLTAKENSDTIKRIASLIISANGVNSQTIIVLQDAKTPVNVSENELNQYNIKVFPNPTNDLVAVQINSVNYENIGVELYDGTGKFIQKTTLYQGSTIAFFDTQTLYSGEYFLRISNGKNIVAKKFLLIK